MTPWEEPLARMVARVGTVEAEVGDRFPLYADPGTGEWTTTRRGSWAGGFWVGQLWLRAHLTGDPEHADVAATGAQRLLPWAEVDTLTRGLVLWYGAAAGRRLGLAGDGTSAEAGTLAGALAGAAALTATWDPEARAFPWGTGFGDPARPLLTRVDGLPGTVCLLPWAQPDRPDVTAALDAHVRQQVELTTAADPGAHAAVWSPGWQAVAEPPAGWSRGEAWLLLALADAAHWVGPGLGAVAMEYAVRRDLLSPDVPPAVHGVPDAPLDTSAAAIRALALLKLGRTDAARGLTQTLVEHHLAADGGLRDGCHDLGRGVATTHELVWGDFFLMLALAVLAGRVAPHDL